MTLPTHDCFFRIGSTHTVCQDYALSVQDEGRTLALVSDGCSGEPGSDIGARLLSHGFVGRWRRGDKSVPKKMADWIERIILDVQAGTKLARYSCSVLAVPSTIVTATLVVAEYDATEGSLYGTIFGDGAIALRMHDRSVLVFQVSPPMNMPAYPTYLTEHVMRYKDLVGPAKSTISVIAFDASGTIQLQQTYFTGENRQPMTGDGWDVSFLAHEPFDLNNSVGPVLTFKAHGVDLVTCFSDGVETGSLKASGARDATSMVFDLMQVKDPRGNFMQRRANKVCQEWKHLDDLAGAAIYLGPR